MDAFYLANRGDGTVHTEQSGFWCNLATADRGGRRGGEGGREKGEINVGPYRSLDGEEGNSTCIESCPSHPPGHR